MTGRLAADSAGTQVLDRLAAVLNALAEAPGPLTAAELAERVELPASTTYRLAQGLERHGLLMRESRGGLALGLRVLELAGLVEDRLDATLVEPARPVMRRLADAHGETAILTALSGTSAIGIASVESRHRIRLSYSRWHAAPLHLGASGKVLLAFADDRVRERVLAGLGSEDDPEGLERELDAARAAGHVVTHGELDEGISGVAAPVLDPRGRLLAGLTLAGPTSRVRDDVDAVASAVTAAAREVSALVAARQEAGPP
jgi:DNA-binding IclR family transcriptional regulator